MRLLLFSRFRKNYSGSFEFVILAEEIEGKQSFDFEDHLLLVRQGVVTDGVGHHHSQLKLNQAPTVCCLYFVQK